MLYVYVHMCMCASVCARTHIPVHRDYEVEGNGISEIGRQGMSCGHELDKWECTETGSRLCAEAHVLHSADSLLWLPRLSVLDTYYIPKDGSLASYKEYISMLPSMDPPEAFGQHPNADVASQITEARTLFETLLSLQPQITPTRIGGQSREEKVGREDVLGKGHAE